jgi:hypothetical protein
LSKGGCGPQRPLRRAGAGTACALVQCPATVPSAKWMKASSACLVALYCAMTVFVTAAFANGAMLIETCARAAPPRA